MSLDIRPMTSDDIEGVADVVGAANDKADREAGEEPTVHTDEQRRQFRVGMRRFITEDPGGSWVAVDDGRVVGMAEAIRRDGFWGLSMLFVHPESQSRGVGRELMTRVLDYADGAEVRMIMSSPDPRALRRYALAGLHIHPAAEASGPIDRSAIPANLRGRDGTPEDLDLVPEVDKALLGRSRRDDVAFVVSNGGVLDVIDDGDGRGFVVLRNSHVTILGATDEDTATMLLWRALAKSEGKASAYCLTAAQDWAVKVCVAARMKLATAGGLFMSGMDQPPGPWIPSGWYF